MALETIMITIAIALLVCVLCQWAAWRVKLPAILFLLVAGIVSGPLLGLFDPEQLMGHLFFPFVQLSVAIILFEGSLTLKFKQILGLQTVLRNMLSFGLVITWLVSTAAARIFIGVSWEIAFLFGALTVVTGPTVIAPMLRAVRPTSAIAHILRWEGIVIDPIGVGLAVLVYEFIIAESIQQAWGQTLLTFAQIVIIGGCIGALAGYIFGLILRKRFVPEYLQNITTLALIFATFVFANSLQHESGLVTVTVLGMWLGNMRGVNLEEILHFKESLSILLISLLFLMLTARLDVAAIIDLGWAGLIVFLVVQFLGRPLNILAAAFRSKLSISERVFLAWIAPRGIVAAAISSLFAIRLESAGFTDARLLVPLTFTIIIGTVLLQSFTALPLARWLKVTESEPPGVLIVGANLVARRIGSALKNHGIRVLLADTGWEQVRAAEDEGLEVYHGSPFSEHADRRMNLTGIGRMFALTPYESVNVAAVMHYRLELGRSNVFSLQSHPKTKGNKQPKLEIAEIAPPPFGSENDYSRIFARLKKGDVVSTLTSQTEDLNDFIRQCENDHGIVFFGVSPEGRVYVRNELETVKQQAGWSLICLIPARSETAEQ